MRYIIMTASAQGTYSANRRNVAVVEVNRAALARAGRERPVMISERAIGVVRIVKMWKDCYNGSTHRCRYQIALAEANKLAANLNFGRYGEDEITDADYAPLP